MTHISFSTQLPNSYLIISKLFNLWNMGFSLLWTGESDSHPADHAELLKGPKKMLDGKVLVSQQVLATPECWILFFLKEQGGYWVSAFLSQVGRVCILMLTAHWSLVHLR